MIPTLLSNYPVTFLSIIVFIDRIKTGVDLVLSPFLSLSYILIVLQFDWIIIYIIRSYRNAGIIEQYIGNEYCIFEL